MASWQDEPQVGQTVWTDERKNGIITGISRSDGLVYCNFYKNGLDILELDLFFGMFDERLNQWIIIPL